MITLKSSKRFIEGPDNEEVGLMFYVQAVPDDLLNGRGSDFTGFMKCGVIMSISEVSFSQSLHRHTDCQNFRQENLVLLYRRWKAVMLYEQERVTRRIS